MIRFARVSLGLLGVIVTSVGAALLLGLGVDNLVAAMVWLVAGVVVHDAVIGPLLIALGAAHPGGKRWAAPLIQAGIVLATVTVVAIPVCCSRPNSTSGPTGRPVKAPASGASPPATPPVAERREPSHSQRGARIC